MALIAGFVLTINGCSVIDSLRFDDRLMVKLPCDQEMPIAYAAKGGWHFRHIARGPVDDLTPQGDWYVAWQTGNPNQPHLSMPWSRWVYAREHALDVMDAVNSAFQCYPTMIEPDLVFTDMSARMMPDMETPLVEKDGTDKKAEIGPAEVTLHYHNAPSAAWPIPLDNKGLFHPFWYKGPNYTQLNDAAAHVNITDAAEIRIGILDNGYSDRHLAVPLHVEDTLGGDSIAALTAEGPGWKNQFRIPGSTGGPHGTGTIGLLAGRKIQLAAGTVHGRPVAGYKGYLGGDPFATIVPVRIAPWVFSLTTANLAYGIDYASRVRHCDVISMSHGGAPSQVWADAVNAAYDHGTAMFAAQGDFFSIVARPLKPRGLVVPSAPVYPAGFRRVMGVTGADANYQGYAVNNVGRLLSHPFSFGSWGFRGSYGAAGSRRSWFDVEETPDPETEAKLGPLRAYPIAAYGPNVPWLLAPSPDDTAVDEVDLDGAGTSAATPQVAAAAALWLGRHRSDPALARNWKTWRKVEAVYDALLESADRTKSANQWPDLYLGSGLLRADDALKDDYDLPKIAPSEAKDWVDAHPYRDPLTHAVLVKYGEAPEVSYDGTESVLGIFSESGLPPGAASAQLDQLAHSDYDQEKALKRLFYNTLLLKAWHAGDLPTGERPPKSLLYLNQDILDKAGVLSDEALARNSPPSK